MLEWTASVTIAIEPVIAPADDLQHDQGRVRGDRQPRGAELGRALDRGGGDQRRAAAPGAARAGVRVGGSCPQAAIRAARARPGPGG